jgi:hypothetical protein
MSATNIGLVAIISGIMALVGLHMLESLGVISAIGDGPALVLIFAFAVVPTALYHYSPLPNHSGVHAGMANPNPKYDSWGWTDDSDE